MINILLAVLLALDQFFAVQFLLLVVLVLFRPFLVGSKLPFLSLDELLILLGSALLLSVNTISNLYSANITEGYWLYAQIRVGLWYVLVIMAVRLFAQHSNAIDFLSVLKKLFWLKMILVTAYCSGLLDPRLDATFFNFVQDENSLIGGRFGSSYDYLFALLVLPKKHYARHTLMLAAILFVSQTRMVLYLAILIACFQFFWGHRKYLVRIAFVAVLTVAVAISFRPEIGEKIWQGRLASISGSSLNDKLVQIEAVAVNLDAGNLLFGEGLGAGLPGITRDRERPYSYEAQSVVLLYQAGFLFLLFHVIVMYWCSHKHKLFPVFCVLLIALTNPALFGLSAIFLLQAYGYLWGIGRSDGD